MFASFPVFQPTALSTPAYVNQRIVVKMKDAPSLGAKPTVRQLEVEQSRIDDLSQRTGVRLNWVRASADGMHVVRMSNENSGFDRTAMMSRLESDPNVQWVEIDRPTRHFAAGPLTGLLNILSPGTRTWYLKATSSQAASSNTETAWNKFHGSASSVVAVLDTGILADHPLVQGHVLPGIDMVADAFIGNDGQSTSGAGDRDYDPTDPGNFVTSADLTAHPECGSTSNSTWHGTFVASIVAGNPISAQNLAPVDWNGYVLPVRVLGKCGGYTSDMADGIRWAAGIAVPGLATNTLPAKVINLSLGAASACSSVLEGSAVSQALAAGSVVVAAAGNSSSVLESPANCSGVIAVGGLDQQGLRAYYSNSGGNITLMAPSGDSAFPIYGATNNGATTAGAQSYGIKIGTSFSAPLVSATVAMMRTVNPSLTPAQITSLLSSTARPFLSVSGNPSCTPATGSAACNCNTASCGAGMLDTAAALNASYSGTFANVLGASVGTPGSNVTLDASASVPSVSGRPLSYTWRLVTVGSTGTNPVLSSTNASSITVTLPNREVAFRIGVSVSDGLSSFEAFKDIVSTNASGTATAQTLPILLSPLVGIQPQGQTTGSTTGTGSSGSGVASSGGSGGGGGGGSGAVGAAWLLLMGMALAMLRVSRGPKASFIRVHRPFKPL